MKQERVCGAQKIALGRPLRKGKAFCAASWILGATSRVRGAYGARLLFRASIYPVLIRPCSSRVALILEAQMRRSGQLVSKAISGKLWMGRKNFRRNAFAESNPCLLAAVLVMVAVLSLGTMALAQSGKESKNPQRQALTDAVPQAPPKKPLLAELGVDTDLGSVSADGVWRPDNPTEKNETAEAVVKLECYRQGGKGLVGTEAFCLEAAASAPYGMLNVGFQWLKVVEWSDTQIIATDDSAICRTSQTIFDLKRKTVTALEIRKPEVRGFNNVCDLLPDRQTYYLQDVADYYVQKQLAAARKSQTK